MCLQDPLMADQGLNGFESMESGVGPAQQQSFGQDQRIKSTYDPYILGPGDSLEIELLNLPELSGRFTIGPDGNLYLPRLRSLYVEGLTVEDLRLYLTQKFRTYVLDPQIYIRPVIFRPVRIYVGGEVKRPGYYTLSGAQFKTDQPKSAANVELYSANLLTRADQNKSPVYGSSNKSLLTSMPTVFDAIRIAQGITPYSDLSQVNVTRKQSTAQGGTRIRTTLNILSLITKGDESQNIRVFDGDVVSISKSNKVMREQLLQASQTNLSPQFIRVFVSGRVNQPGAISIPQGSSLNQAIGMAGGASLIKGKVEFLRFTLKGDTVRRIFNYNPRASAGDANNPVLSGGDIIRIQDSILSAATTILNEITAPAVGVYTIFSLLENFK